MLAKFSWNLVRSDAPRVRNFEANNKIREALKSAHSPETEKQSGFRRVYPNSGFDGPVVVSDEFNALEMSGIATDWPLIIHGEKDISKKILGSLKSQRVHFVNYAKQAMMKAILRNKALINEKKVGFAEQFPPVGKYVSIDQTD